MSETTRKNLRSLKRSSESRRIRFLLAVIALLIISAALGFIFVRSYLPVKNIVFFGNSYIKNDELRGLMQVKKADPLYNVSARTLAQRLKKSPWVKDVFIRREPWGNMIVKIREALPVALMDIGVEGSEGFKPRPYLVDADGIFLEQLKEGTELFLPVIRGMDPQKNSAAYKEAIKFIRLLHSRRISTQSAVEITGTRPEDLTMRANAINVKIGSGDFEKKLEKLFVVKDEIEKKNIRVDYIDLRFSDKIIVKPVAEEMPGTEAVKKRDVKKRQ